MAEVSNPDEFISAREFAQLHDLNYAVLVRKLKEGKYESAIKDKSNRWYIRQDEEIDGCREGYVTAKEYAEQNGISYSVMTSELNRGYYNINNKVTLREILEMKKPQKIIHIFLNEGTLKIFKLPY